MKPKKKRKLQLLQSIRKRYVEKRWRKRPKKNKNKPIIKTGFEIPRRIRRGGSYNNNIWVNGSLKSNHITRINKAFLSKNLSYLLYTQNSPFNIRDIREARYQTCGQISIPQHFSIIDNADQSFLTLRKIISALFVENCSTVVMDYEKCDEVELNAQVILDIILKDYIKYCNFSKKTYSLRGININNESVKKLLFSVGSPAVLKVQTIEFEDVIKYPLCVHDIEKTKDLEKRINQKDIDTTTLVDYVIDSLKRMNKQLTNKKRHDLCTVIGETLINAEEHSTTKYRFSIGYFQEEKINEKHFGVFRLVIMNFGKTIYEKFKDEECPNQDIVKKMKDLSNNYTKQKFFSIKKFEEETLWTLYALQEGVTSIPYEKYQSRGNGSIRFIESFFNIKGSPDHDDISRMIIASGKSRIVFDGTYHIEQKKDKDETFRVMTFNKSGSLDNKPDDKFVYNCNHYFPGTLISVKLLLNEDDIKQIN